jgi:hypothetical protein
MSLQIPPSANYPDVLISVPARWANPPVEGNRMVQCSAKWGTMGGAGPQKTITFQMANNANINFRQIVALSVDNSQNGCDVQFLFPDTGETLTIPAGNPKVICPVFTNATEFWLTSGFNSQVLVAGDVTNFSIHNSLPPPIAVPTSEEQNVATAAAAVADGTTPVQLIAAGVNGTLEGISVYRASPASGISGPAAQTWAIQDGTGKTFASGTFAGGNLSSWNVLLHNQTNIRGRFTNGLVFVQSGGNLGGTYSINTPYRTP